MVRILFVELLEHEVLSTAVLVKYLDHIGEEI